MSTITVSKNPTLTVDIEPENKTEKTTLNIFLLLRVISLFTRWFSHFRNSNMIKLEKSMEKEESESYVPSAVEVITVNVEEGYSSSFEVVPWE